MRMRRKKNLEKRLAACADYLFFAQSEDKNVETAILKKEYLNYKKIFGNGNPVQMEIGCGKGGFVCELAAKNPDINYIAVEKSSNVIVSACERASRENLKNIIFINSGAEYLPKYIPERSIDRIYLNFSCPFPKKKYENHRLTSRHFLVTYGCILKQGAEIHQKTDNMRFFEYSMEQLSDFGFTLKNISLDLHNSGFEGNIETEYEKRFSRQGLPIYRLEAYLK